jgi:IS605 OrfB family transposase
MANYQELCREVAGVEVGELSVTAIRSVVRRYSDKGHPPLVVRLARAVPYPEEWVRSVTLVCEAGRLFVDVTAAVPVAEHDLDPEQVGGVRQTHHMAAKTAVSWAVERRVGTLVVGHPKTIRNRNVGRIQNRRLATWRFAHLLAALREKAERAGIKVVTIDERGTSSTCPECRQRVPKPSGRAFSCPHCGYQGHRDVVGARNIAARGGGTTTAPAVVTHRRAGKPPARRDRRRHLYDQRRSGPAPGRPPPGGSRSLGTTPEGTHHPEQTLEPLIPNGPARIADIATITAKVH